ncbi:MAG: tripartite tricarboxylate transporter substrate binding protein [Proteobacteria bacterium]|nr:tripartite tricarboxylate transporter substrate binding protein [Burkholderiales bacterium]
MATRRSLLRNNGVQPDVRAGVCIALMLLVCSSAALAQLASPAAYPVKTVRMIVAYPPGGGTDIVARMLAPRLADALGQSVVIDNRGGAAGNIGTEVAARAAPDGYTLLMGNVAPNAINVSLGAIPFDPVKDFAPISLVASTPNVLVVHPSLPVKTVKDLLALARARPGQLAFPSAGNGSSSHLAGELLKSLARIEMLHVPYKGGGPALADLLGGQVQLMFATAPAAMPLVKAGRLRAIAVTSRTRSAALPDLPTIAEVGVTGYDASTWYGLLAPAGTPRALVDRVHAETVKVFAVPEFREKLTAQGFEPIASTPAEFAAYIQAQIEVWARVIKQAGILAQ